MTETLEKKTTTRTKKNEPVKIKVNNTEIVVGQIYELVGKKDLDAPQPLNGTPTVKLPTPGNGESKSIVWDESIRRWDTGFEEVSPCNKNIAPEAKKAFVDTYVKHIQKPYEQFYGVDTSAVSNDFWGGNDEKEIPPYMYQIGEGKQYDTKHIKDLFDLFHALKQGKVCEIGERDAMLQRSAVYCVRNIEKTISMRDERMMKKAEATITLKTLVDALDPEKDDTLYTVLEWIQYTNIRGADKTTLMKRVLADFEREKTGADTVDRFLSAYEMATSDTHRQEMELFSILSRLNVKKKLQYTRSQYYLDNELLGNTLKDVAKSAMMDTTKKQLILDEWDKIN